MFSKKNIDETKLSNSMIYPLNENNNFDFELNKCISYDNIIMLKRKCIAVNEKFTSQLFFKKNSINSGID